MWQKYFNVIKITPGRIVSPRFGTIDLANPNIKLEIITQLYEDNCPYLQITPLGLQEIYDITPVQTQNLASPPPPPPQPSQPSQKPAPKGRPNPSGIPQTTSPEIAQEDNPEIVQTQNLASPKKRKYTRKKTTTTPPNDISL